MLKKRNWSFVGYPESLPENWKEIIQEKGIAFAISPLHEFDINPDGEEKKPHYHVILCYDGPTTKNNVNDLVVNELKQPYPIALDSVTGMYRYFTHKDNPEKFQYNENEIQCFNGFDIEKYCGLTKTQIRQLKVELIVLIKNKDFTYYNQLIDYLLENNLLDMLEVAFQFTFMLNSYLKSSSQMFIDKQSKILKNEKN